MTTSMTTSMTTGKEIEFIVFGRRIAGRQWGNPSGAPTIGLHGWLDNANTFNRLAPLLPELNLIALDFAGHGKSDHRPPGAHYHPLYDIQDVLAIANELNWHQFHVIGHSMGAAIACELSATFPERIRSSVQIDGFLATGGNTPEDRLEQTRLAIEKILNPHHQARVFDNVEAMAQRVTEATDQSIDAAKDLVERGHKKVAGGITWSTDPRIRYPTPLRHSRDQIDLLLRNSTSRSLLIVAQQGDDWYQAEIPDAEKQHPNLVVERMAGPHHVHLEPKYAATVAEHIRRFFILEDG